MSVIHKTAVLVAIAALGIGLTTTATTTQPAQAEQASASVSETSASVGGAYGCSGTLVEQEPIVSQWGTLYGYTDLYWDGTYNCAVTVHAPGYQGSSLPTGVRIQSVMETAEVILDDQRDEGTYTSYAGPVSVYGLNRCIRLTGYISGVSADDFAPHC